MQRFRTHLLLLASLLLSTTLSAQRADSPFTIKATLFPEQTSYFAGQTVRLVLEFEAQNEEVSRISVGGLPDPEWAQARQSELFELAESSTVSDGVTLNTRRFACDYYLLQSGTFSFQPRANVMLARRIQRGASSVFGSFVQSYQASARANHVTISVAPLPPAPPEACGLVGDFRLEASIDPTEASPGDLINLRWTLQGIANFEDFRLPDTATVQEFKVYDPAIEVDSTNDLVRISQVFVPQSFAATNIPVVRISFFNPSRGDYQTLCAGPFPLRLHERTVETLDDFPISSTNATAPAAPTPITTSSSNDLWNASDFQLPASTQGYLAPSTESLRLRTLPAHAHVHVLERSGPWLRVESNASIVWILAPLSLVP